MSEQREVSDSQRMNRQSRPRFTVGHGTLGGDSPNVALRHSAFRGYADHMHTKSFVDSLERTLDASSRLCVAIMCAESLWWRCHRRLIADAAVLLCGVNVLHLGHHGKLSPHRLTEGVRLAASGNVVYDVNSDVASPASA